MSFQAPVRDLLFTLKHVVEIGRLSQGGAFAELDEDTLAAVLEAAGQVTTDILAPLNRKGDQAGALYQNGKVTAAPGFADAYKAFAEGGWTSLSADPEFGGQGLPKVLELAVLEMVNAANMAFALCPILTQGAVEAIHAHGSDRQKALYLPNMISGTWTGAMNLTEPQSGSDLGTLTTRAEPDGNGGWLLHGQKIFITWGDHDAAENIVHLVLARLPGAPEGSRGISLFIAPKVLVNEDGSLGQPNALRAGSIEHKLGIHASPTCVMLFEGAKAELIGQPNKGLAHMFTMMNAARLNIGAQGVGIAERAYQQALAFTQERRQGRSPWSHDASAAIFDHPDVRRTLIAMKVRVEAARAICLLTALNADLAASAAEPEIRAAAKLREEVLTPIAKAWSSDIGVEVASMGLQLHGGMGFIEETGAAQHYRDARIAPIYEGTNGIQAIDLAGRKLGLEDGAGIAALIRDVDATVEALNESGDMEFDAIGHRLGHANRAFEAATSWLAERRGGPDALAGATPYLKLVGDVLGGWLLAKGALAASKDAGSVEDRRRRLLAGHYAETLLAQAPGYVASVTAGAEALHALTPEMLG
ncbi:acyl-CoA dehydrogenase [Phenylobacterium montanum]|uniref:Acyl-CoA dehydrogenase n=1 Tax=Phenylobacterium montanum TaxID=2823693 RepID=A0A975FXN1_9CAUL|nr:acyl-CoA dehydrogenase [Caulobacter sp. S6]QUD87305.1 acyl-CoA dehydrogenase [Caulobacter sp. S6]